MFTWHIRLKKVKFFSAQSYKIQHWQQESFTLSVPATGNAIDKLRFHALSVECYQLSINSKDIALCSTKLYLTENYLKQLSQFTVFSYTLTYFFVYRSLTTYFHFTTCVRCCMTRAHMTSIFVGMLKFPSSYFYTLWVYFIQWWNSSFRV